ncbi:MAG: hypothetical protein RR590_02770, partial [Hungatella sp.]
MKKKIYWNLCLIALVAVVLSSALTTVIYYRNLETQMKREVITEARYLEVGIELSGATFLDTLAEKGRMARPSRMTLIAQDGVVLYDNYAAPKTMENHKNRPE